MIPSNHEELRQMLKLQELPGDELVQRVLLESVREMLQEKGEDYLETLEGRQRVNLALAYLGEM